MYIVKLIVTLNKRAIHKYPNPQITYIQGDFEKAPNPNKNADWPLFAFEN